MKQLLKDNGVLVAGIALPLILAAFFWISQQATTWGVEPPKTGVVFVQDYYYGEGAIWDIKVRDGQLAVTYLGQKDDPQYIRSPRIFLYMPATGLDKMSRPIDVPQITKENYAAKQEFVIPLPGGLRVTEGETSPDGYQFVMAEDYNRGFLMEVFAGSRRNDRYVLQKGNYKLHVPGSGYNARLIGWAAP